MMNKKNQRKAKFFCESCGAEVRSKDKFCSHCGKFFSSVKCPKCGKIGTTEEFLSGCPDCGYAVKSKAGTTGSAAFSFDTDIFTNSFISRAIYHSKKRIRNMSLPLWIYILCISILFFLIICLYLSLIS